MQEHPDFPSLEILGGLLALYHKGGGSEGRCFCLDC